MAIMQILLTPMGQTDPFWVIDIFSFLDLSPWKSPHHTFWRQVMKLFLYIVVGFGIGRKL